MRTETIYEKGVREINEDSLLVADPKFGVFDGASSVDPYRSKEGKTGAAIASRIAHDTFLAGNKPLIELAIDTNDAIAKAMQESGIDTSRKTALWATTAAVVRRDKDTMDWLRIADSLIVTIAPNGSYKSLGSYEDHDLETMLMWQELAKKRTENIRKELNEQILKVRRKANIAYGVLDGEKEAENFLQHGTVSLDEVAHVALFTDGLFIPKEDPQEPDDLRTFVDLFLEGGLKKVHEYVREKEKSDPKCWKYPRFKQHDDIAAVALSF